MNPWLAPSGLHRHPEARQPDLLEEAWRSAAVVEADSEGNFAGLDGRPNPMANPGARRQDDIYLGEFSGRHWFVRPVPALSGPSVSWRTGDPADADLLAAVVAYSRWHGQMQLCETCGAATLPDLGGARRICPSCGRWAFPRTDPCVIVAITDPADRLLLARSAAWPPGRRSIIAGFIEAGESAEQACHREVAEEVGITLTSLRYVSSQPWPMPRSLMLGYEAVSVGSQIAIDGDEIVEGDFYSREDLAAAVAASELTLPNRVSIARQLIDSWFNRR